METVHMGYREITGTLKEGDRAWAAHGYATGTTPPGISSKWSLYRPIKFLARMVPPLNGLTRHEVHSRYNYLFEPDGSGHYYLPRDIYEHLFDWFPWNWHYYVCRFPAVDGDIPSIEETIEEDVKLLARAFTEGKKEGLVVFLFNMLGYGPHPPNYENDDFAVHAIGPSARKIMVYRVKPSVLAATNVRQARFEAFGHAMDVGAQLVVVTDGDTYEVYDRTKGLDYESTLRGTFQLTSFNLKDDLRLLDLLSSKGLIHS